MKYSYEVKLRAVLSVINDHRSSRSVAAEIGSEQKHIRRWVALYKAHGVTGLLHKHTTYSGEFKVSVIRYMHENHLSLFETAIKFGIPNDSVVCNWERIYYEQGESGLMQENRGRKKTMRGNQPKKRKLEKQTEEDLISEVQRLRAENAYLKKLQALVQERIARENESGQKPLKD